MRGSGKPRFRCLPLILDRAREGKAYVALITDLSQRVEVPEHKGEWIELRHLSRRQLREASRLKTYEALDTLNHMSRDTQAAITEANERRGDADVQAALTDPFTSYDLDALLAAGITAWSYDEPVTPETIDRLDLATAEWAGRQLLTIAGVIQSEAARKNG